MKLIYCIFYISRMIHKHIKSLKITFDMRMVKVIDE